MIEKLKLLIKDWENEAKFLSNCDAMEDRYAGQVYAGCAKELKDILLSQSTEQGEN